MNRSERGSASAEAMIAITAIMLVLLLAVATGRVVIAGAAVEAAARDAARQASIARTGTQATSRARAGARDSLRSQGVPCTSINVQVDTTRFATPVGRPASVSATVTCVVPLADLAFPGLPGSVVRRAKSTSPLDPYRGRSLGSGRAMPGSHRSGETG
ncbi:pilus assembly protein [Spongiactinospora rosea]|uniref:Pilus assembly protein n=1 Tax=Spongiactinospora rosea TaxID=2248750 RepID=A0A366M572_9ACTN|nr:TadE/TadG family type IV pilus assembly protein [Spongiactinospora rosea]RBQ21187.1 pilus assembly protein [Spongiactinospora rosea]